MLPSSPSNTSSPYAAQTQQQYESDADRDDATLASTAMPDSPARSSVLSTNYPYTSQMHSQTNSYYQSNTTTSSTGYLSPLTAQHSTVPQIRSPLAMGFSGQGSTASTGFNTRSGYGSRIRGRRDSFQQSTVAFSPTLAHGSSPNSSSSMAFQGASSLYSQQSRLGYLWPSAGPASTAGGQRNRCLSTSSVDSNASSIGLSHLTPALAAMTVQHQQQTSPVNSPYHSYTSSPQQGGLQHHYQQQHQSSSETPYPYHSPFSSPLPPSQVSAYDALSMTATNITSGVYGSTPPMQSTTDVLYHSTAQFGPTAAGYSGTSRCTSGSALQLAPSLYSDQYSSRISQTQFESTSPLSASTTSGIRSLDYSDQYQQSQTQYYNQSPQQQGLGILVSGGMAREMSTSPMDDSRDDSQQEQVEQLSSSMKRSTSASGTLQTADDIHAVIGKDGKTLVYICPKCDPSKVVEFTTKSNLKRHLENKNIHNTPYERRRDQKRWQGHEKKQVSRDETTLRMRKWRNCNPEKNRFNDMRCRVYRNARKIYGEGYSEAKEDYIRSEIERRKQNMIIRNSRRAEWANQAANNSGNGVQELSTSPSDSPISASTSGSAGFQIPESAFMFSSPYTSSPSMMVNQQIPSYGSGEETSYAQDSSSRSDKAKPDESKFLQDLKENRLPPRRRSRSALHTSMGTGGSQGENDSMTSVSMSHNSSNILSYATRNDSPFVSIASHASGFTADSFEYGSPSPQQKAIRRPKKQRSVTDNPDFFRQNHPYVTSSALGGFSSVAASSSGSYQDGYVDSTQQLQMLEQKYSSGTMAHSLFLSKSGMDQQPQQIHESLESVVESMEINQAVNLATSTGTATTGSTAPSGGLYGDRDASAWLTPSVTYNTHGLAQEAQPEDGSRGFPFPVIRDRKELARAAGIRLDIPNQHPLASQHWISGVSGTHSEATMDELVGGSATSLESSIAQAEYSPLANSPLSGALSSPTHGIATSNNIHEDDDDEGNGNSDNVSQAIHNQYHGHSDSASGMIKQKGSHFEVFNVSMPLYGQSLSTSESGFFATDAATLNEANYLAKEQAVVRRHSTAMANLSTL